MERFAAAEFALALLGSALFLACENRTGAPADAGPNEPSPNASILPAPLSSAPDPAGTPLDAGSPSDAGSEADAGSPLSLREDVGLPEDAADLREPFGFFLKARFRFADLPLAARPPEANVEALDRARASSAFEVGIDLGSGRMRLRLASERFLLPEGTEIRARTDLYGHVLVFPDGSRYVTLKPGALRAVLNERRADAQKLQRVVPLPLGSGKALGHSSEKAAIVTPLGRLELEQARVAGAIDNGIPLCRLLLELVGAHAETSACATDLLPVRAEYFFNAGRLAFEVTALERVATADAESLKIPPRSAEHRIAELPTPRSPLLLQPAQTRAFRLRAARTEPKDNVKEGLFLVNHDDLEEYVLIDGVPVARLGPGGGGLALDLLPGSYTVSTRSFLGDEVSQPVIATVPSRFVAGVPSDATGSPGAR